MRSRNLYSQSPTNLFAAAAILLYFCSTSAQSHHRAPDYILANRKIFTANAAVPYAEAIAIQGERILAVGTSEEISRVASPRTIRIDLKNRVVITCLTNPESCRRATGGLR